MWIDLLLLALIAREIYIGIISGIRGAVVRGGLVLGILIFPLLLTAGISKHVSPVIGPTFASVIETRLAIAVGGEAEAVLDIIGPWRVLLAVPADSFEAATAAVVKLATNVTGYIVAMLALWAVAVVVVAPGPVSPRWEGCIAGLVAGLAWAVVLLLCLPVLAILDQTGLLAAGLAESWLYSGLMPVLTRLAWCAARFFLGG